ncbi:MAG: uroporphyrinogen decarboxylase family protein [Candidatus Latescibacteria bacterium]|nr:uroporphyrinogen decarboxylase family protein [Candidatus Latescibacterota bacterium]
MPITQTRYVVRAYFPTLCRWTNTRLVDAYTRPEAAARLYRKGPDAIRRHFPPQTQIPTPQVPGISYLHLTCLGAHLVFPEDDGEPNCRSIQVESLGEAIDRLERPMAFDDCFWIARYLEFGAEMERLLGEPVRRSLGKEGPVTTASLLLDRAFHEGLIVHPEQAHRILELVVDSMVAFDRFTRRVNDEPLRGTSASIVDDLASLLSPDHWKTFVTPYWERYYSRALGNGGTRYLHVENVRTDHLPLIEAFGVDHYDPSHAPGIDPSILHAHLSRTPWQWEVQAVHVLEGREEMRRQIARAVEYGACRLVMLIHDTVEPDDVWFFVEEAERAGAVSM